jgi:hypothetical protein
LLQLYGEQLVVIAGPQVPAPSQVRADSRESPMHAAGAHCVPEPRGEHCPTVPAMLQDTHEPVQAESQQTPWGAQKFDVQSLGFMHGWPIARVPQLPPVQTAGGAHPLAGGVQLVAQAVALPHAYGAHDIAGGATQLPLPSHAGA